MVNAPFLLKIGAVRDIILYVTAPFVGLLVALAFFKVPALERAFFKQE